ncbi:MAG: bifunctional glycosyltransferase family 2/GtrA family protein [Clostridia bacterium]|nr:bifunctional glycosyltransferase family 2/GtrA family protein [Clostridia bacterium]
MRYVVLIPAYNPGEKMIGFLKELKSSNLDVIVVDDGSKAESKYCFDYAKKCGYPVLTHPVNKGKGAALKTGFTYVVSEKLDYDYVITADCDGQHAIESIIDVANEGEKSGCEAMILGGRFRDGGDKLPIKSNIGNSTTRVIFKLATGLSIHDTQTGLRAIPKSLYSKMITIKGDRYEYEMNMLLKINEWQVPFKEVSIKTIYFDNNKGSHYSPFKDSIRILSQILIFSLSSFLSFILDYALFMLVNHLLFDVCEYHVAIAYLTGRVISGVVNYVLNSKFVFKEFSMSSVLKYTLLCIIIMVIGAVGSYLLEDLAGIPGVLSKVFVDLPLFLLSYFGQKKYVFTKKG